MADLSPVEPVTDEDKACGMDRRARLFKAATWEGLKMTAKRRESLYTYNADRMAQMRKAGESFSPARRAKARK